MSAIRMLVRAGWRRHWRASLFLAIVAGLAATVVGASFQAAARAETSLERFSQRSRVFDELVSGCPPGVGEDQISDQADALELCVNERLAKQFRGVLDDVTGVERTAVASTLVVALLDPSVSNGWGRLTLLAGITTPHAPLFHPIIVEGRLADPAADDEIVMGEAPARVAGVHAGDVVHLAGWRQADLDAAIDGTVEPQTRPFTSKVVGIVRDLADVQPSGTGSLSDVTLPGNITLVAGAGWMAVHADDFSGYGSGVLVRLRGGPSSVKAFQAELNKAPDGWFSNAEPVNDTSPASIQRVIDLEQRALLVFACIAILAGVAFGGLTSVRQLRRESTESLRLAALGMTRRDLRMVNVGRALTTAMPACAIAVAGVVALSPLGPIGLARKLEFDLTIRVDVVVLAATVSAILALFTLAGVVTPVDAAATEQRGIIARTSRLDPALRHFGPVAVVGASIARVRSSRAAIAVTAIALAAGIGAGCLVASHDRLIGTPQRYGAWWDLAVGQYSEQGPLDDGISKLRANDAVIAAAGYDEQSDIGTIDGTNSLFLASTDYIGHHGPVMADGRAPAADDEVALGRDTADAIRKGIGDRVTVLSNNDAKLHLRVVGIAVINDPIASDSGAAGNGAFVRPRALSKIRGPGSVAQSIVVKLDPHRDRAAAIESVRRDFSGSIREAIPQVDIRNLSRLRAVPWLMAALIGILALATLIHALATMLRRNRTTLGVLAVLGFTRGQRRGVCVFATTALVFVGVVIGIPFGLVLGDRLWRAIVDGIDLTSSSVFDWPTMVVASTGAIVMAALVALVASRGSVRTSPSEQLRVE